MNLKNKTIVITGAAGGFGTELVEIFCNKGAQVEALDIQKAALKTLKSKMQDKGYDIVTFVVDVTKPEDFENYTVNLERRKFSPDVWINNAGIADPRPFSEMELTTFAKVMNVNLNGVVYGTHTALKLMEKRQIGFIVNVASVAGHVPAPFLSSYTASKHAVVGFTRSLQVELYQKASPIRICLVSPGFADTEIMRANKEFKIPKILAWTIGSAREVATNIVNAVIKEKDEVYPVLSGRAFLSLYRYAPKRIFRLASRALTARTWRELVGLEGIRSR